MDKRFDKHRNRLLVLAIFELIGTVVPLCYVLFSLYRGDMRGFGYFERILVIIAFVCVLRIFFLGRVWLSHNIADDGVPDDSIPIDKSSEFIHKGD